MKSASGGKTANTQRIVSQINNEELPKVDVNSPNMNKSQQYHERKRKQKEAKKNQHFQATGSKHSKESYEPSEPFMFLNNEPKKKEVVTMYFWKNAIGFENGPYYDGMSYLALSDKMLIAQETQPIKCKNFGIGFFMLGDELNENISPYNPCVSLLTIEGYRRLDCDNNDLFQIPMTYHILTPLWQVYSKNMPTATVTDKVVNALSSLAIRQNIPLEYTSLVDSTILAYVAFLHRRETLILKSTDMLTKTANNAEVLGISERHRLDTLCLFDVQEVYMPITVDNTSCIPVDYEVRDDFKILKGREYTWFNKPNFRPGGEYKRRYQTVFGSFRGLGQDYFVQYESSAHNMNVASKRLLGCKGSVDNENNLRLQSIASAYAVKLAFDARIHTEWNSQHRVKNNDVFIRLLNNRYYDRETIVTDQHHYMAKQVIKLIDRCNMNTLQSFVDSLQNCTNWGYYMIYSNFLHLTNYQNSREAAAAIKNCKKKLREHIVNGRQVHTADDIMVSKLEAKIKREMAKYNKPARLFVTYGDGSMYANELPEYIKVCLDGLHILELDGFTCYIYIMAKPKDETLEFLFNELHEARSMNNHMTIIIYSDDFCLAGQKNGKSFGGNGDISSNDSSQDMAAFFPVYMMLANFDLDRAEGLIEQCMLPIEFKNPENSKEKILVQFDGPVEGSGTTLTTILNHVGDFNNCVGIFYYFVKNDCSIEEAVNEGSKSGGHVVTFETWGDTFEKCQFLKRSPARVDGKYVPVVNMGCILRSLGSIDDDLECRHLGVTSSVFGNMSFPLRMDLFMSSVIRGWKHEPQNRILQALRERFCAGQPSEADVLNRHGSLEAILEIDVNKQTRLLEEIVTDRDYSAVVADNLNERYGLDDDEITEAVQLIKNFQLGWHVSCRAFAKIYHVDYGLPL